MSAWILILIALGLLGWSLLRERFEPTASIRAPPYTASDHLAFFELARTSSQTSLLARARPSMTLPTTDPTYPQAHRTAAGKLLAPAVESFFTSVFRPATTPITEARVKTFMRSRVSTLKPIEEEVLIAYFVRQQGIGGNTAYNAILAAEGQGVGYLTGAAPPPGSGPAPPVGTSTAPAPMCPTGLIRRAEDGLCVRSTPGPSPTCPAGYTLRGNRRCRRTGGTEVTDATQCPAGFEYNAASRACDTRPVNPTCPGGFVFQSGVCRPTTTAAFGSTTGGSSVTTMGPTTGGPASRLKQVFGPQFAGSGGTLGGSGGDSSRTNVYPQLLGGIMDTSTRVPGAGITSPSKSWTLANDGSLPNQTALGSDEMSRYFPFSRSPGDMDVIPDPYRVAQSFSASNYSSKTDPVPFLTDFSAFQS